YPGGLFRVPSVPSQRFARHGHAVRRGHPNHVYGAGQVRRSRVVRGHTTVTDGSRAIPMPKRNVVGLGLREVLVADAPRTMGVGAPFVRWHIVAVCDDHLPACRTWAERPERWHVVEAAMRAAADFQIMLVEHNRLKMRD